MRAIARRRRGAAQQQVRAARQQRGETAEGEPAVGEAELEAGVADDAAMPQHHVDADVEAGVQVGRQDDAADPVLRHHERGGAGDRGERVGGRSGHPRRLLRRGPAVDIDLADRQRQRQRWRRPRCDMEAAIAVQRAEIEGEMIERQRVRRTGKVGADGHGLRQRRGQRDPGQGAEERPGIAAGELELAREATVIGRPGQQRIELKPRRGLGRHRELHRHLRRVGRAAVQLETHRRAARHQVSRRGDLAGGGIDREIGIDVLEALDAAPGAPGHGAVLDGEPGQRRDPGRGGGRLARRRRTRLPRRRRGGTRPAPVRRAIRQPLEIDLRVDQRGAARLDPAGQQRQQRQLHFERPQPYHEGGGRTGRVGDAQVPRGQRRRRQQAEADRPGELDRLAGAFAELGRDRGLEALDVEKPGRDNEAGEDEDEDNAE